MSIHQIHAYQRKVKLNDNDVYALQAVARHGGPVIGVQQAGQLIQRPGSPEKTPRELNLAGGLAMSRLTSLGMLDMREEEIEGQCVRVYQVTTAGHEYLAQGPEQPPTRAMIVEDSLTDAYRAKMIAIELFDEVLVVPSAAELTRTLPLFRPDLVFMDVVLGSWENGLSLIQEVRHRADDLSVVPFAVLSSKDQESDIAWAKEQGAGAYVIKPATRERMEAAVRGLLLGWPGPCDQPGEDVTGQY